MIRAGTAQVDITPHVGAELSGFALRQQPSIGLLDPLYAKAIFLEDDAGHRLLWIHSDLIGLDDSWVGEFRRRARALWNLDANQVLLSATHTHAGPATIHLFHAGEYDVAYLQNLRGWFEEAGHAAMGRLCPCRVAVGNARLDLGVDRRRRPSAHVDPRLTAILLQTPGHENLAVIINYAMHPVALGPENRLIGTDFCGPAASMLRDRLGDRSMILVTNGACGNINPPALNVSAEQLQQWSSQIADAAMRAVVSAQLSGGDELTVATRQVALEAEDKTEKAVEAHAARHFLTSASSAEPDARKATELIDQAARRWREHRLRDLRSRPSPAVDIELFVLRLPGMNIIGLNAEIFSRFTDLVRGLTSKPVCTLGYANGNIGYVPTRQAFEEGGYEVNTAMFYYDRFRPAAGGLERLASIVADLI